MSRLRNLEEVEAYLKEIEKQELENKRNNGGK